MCRQSKRKASRSVRRLRGRKPSGRLAQAGRLDVPVARGQEQHPGNPRYPDRLTSLKAAKEGFETCSKHKIPPQAEKADANETAAFQRAVADNTFQSLKQYVAAYPTGQYLDLLLTAMKEKAQSDTKKNPPSFMTFFDYNSSRISAQTMTTLDQVLAAYKEVGGGNIFLTAHTDTYGPAEYRTAIGLSRANAIKSVLVERGIPPVEITVASFGSRNLSMEESVLEPQNRRVEIQIIR